MGTDDATGTARPDGGEPDAAGPPGSGTDPVPPTPTDRPEKQDHEVDAGDRGDGEGPDHDANERRANGSVDDASGHEEGGDDGEVDDHLEDVPDGAGCTEIWEHLSGRRDGGTDR